MILTWQQRCEIHPDHQDGMVSNQMIQARMQEEIYELRDLQNLVKSFFKDYLDVTEESDSGREFHPIYVSCGRALKTEPLNELLEKMRELI